jgi:hypothetical protein
VVVRAGEGGAPAVRILFVSDWGLMPQPPLLVWWGFSTFCSFRMDSALARMAGRRAPLDLKGHLAAPGKKKVTLVPSSQPRIGSFFKPSSLVSLPRLAGGLFTLALTNLLQDWGLTGLWQPQHSREGRGKVPEPSSRRGWLSRWQPTKFRCQARVSPRLSSPESGLHRSVAK